MSSNALYPLWPAFAALAAWLPERTRRANFGGGARTHAAALAAAVTCILLLVVNEWIDVPAPSVVLAALALGAAVHRTVLALAVSVRETRAAGRDREIVDDVRDALEDGDLTLHSHLRMNGWWGVYPHGRRWGKSPRRAWLVIRTDEHDVVQFDGPVLELMTDSR